MLNQQDSGMADGKRGASRGKDPCKVSQKTSGRPLSPPRGNWGKEEMETEACGLLETTEEGELPHIHVLICGHLSLRPGDVSEDAMPRGRV